MPIRHCQKCGLKVLIDESQAGANPFYCQRCTTAMKGPDAGSDDLLAAAAPAKRTPVPAPAAVAVAPAKAATVKVLCPYCKASFNGRIPQKPARGSCPVCQKELILLPNGDIRPAAGFDVNQWQSEGAAPPAKEPGTRTLVKKYAADPASAAAKKESGTKVVARKAPEPPPPPPPEPALTPPDETATEESGALPSWLDDTSEGNKPTAPPTVEDDAPVPAPETDEEVPVRLEDLPPAGPPVEEEPPPPAALPPAAVAPPPPPPPKAAGRKPAPAAGRRMTERRVAPAGAPAPTGAGKFMLALFLAALPVAACGVLLGVQEKLKGTVLEQVGQRFAKGFLELSKRINPPETKAPPPVEAPKPPPAPEEPAKPGPEDQARDENEILKIWNDWRFANQKIKQLSVGADDAQKAEIEKAKEQQKEREQKMDSLCERYKKIYGKEYDPRKQ